MIAEIWQRRYRCQRCGAVVTVRPIGILRRYLYTAMALVLAFVLWSHAGLSARAVRERVSPNRKLGHTAAPKWASLVRWAAAARRLWRGLGSPPSTAGPREIAGLVSTQIAARAPVGSGSLITDAFTGAAHAV